MLGGFLKHLRQQRRHTRESSQGTQHLDRKGERKKLQLCVDAPEKRQREIEQQEKRYHRHRKFQTRREHAGAEAQNGVGDRLGNVERTGWIYSQTVREDSDHVAVQTEKEEQKSSHELCHDLQHADVGLIGRINRRGIGISRLQSQNLRGENECF